MFLPEPSFKKSDDIKLIFFAELKIFHVLVKNDKIDPELISPQSRPNDGLGDIVDDVRIGNKTKAHSSQSIWSLIWIVGRNISIADLAHRVDSPVESVEILKMPRQTVDGRVGS